mgnify:CR=1 FL=1
MRQPKLFEGLQKGDLVNCVEHTFTVDQFTSKMGNDRDVAVLRFRVKDKFPAIDMMEFIEKGYPFVLDADISSGEEKDGNYSVFVELERTKQLPQQIKNILNKKTNSGESADTIPVKEEPVEKNTEESDQVAQQAQPSFQTFSKFDFVPGEKIASNAQKVKEAKIEALNMVSESGLYSVPGLGKILKKGSMLASPVFRGLSSDFQFFRDFVNSIADHGIRTAEELQGFARPDSAESILSYYRATATKFSGAYLEHYYAANGLTKPAGLMPSCSNCF